MGEKSQSLFERALQSPEATRLREGWEKGGVLSLNGLSPSGKPFAALLAALSMGRPLCVLASAVKQQELFYSEIAGFTSLLKKMGKSLDLLFLPESGELTLGKVEGPVLSGVEGRSLHDLEGTADLLFTLRFLQKKVLKPDFLKIVVATQTGALQPLPSPSALEKMTRRIAVGDTVELERAMGDLVAMGYESLQPPATILSARGQFVKRGGILDLFPFQSEDPLRLEFDGDRIESIRYFDLAKQTSLRSVSEAEWVGMNFSEKDSARLKDYLDEGFLVWTEGKEAVEVRSVERAPSAGSGQEVRKGGTGELTLEIFGHDFLSGGALDVVLQEQRGELLERHLRDWAKEGFQVHIFCNNEGEEKRLRELLKKSSLLQPSAFGLQFLSWHRGELLHGFIWPETKIVVLSDAEIFGRYQNLSPGRLQRKGRLGASREPLDFTQFADGEAVVHAQHGIGRFLGIREVEVSGRMQEVLTLEYAHGALLHVPIEQAYLVGRYLGVGKSSVRLDELGSNRWAKATASAQRAVMDYAAQLLRVQAEREHYRGFSFAPDQAWQKEFEEAFIYEETPDQLRAIGETKQDMEAPRPMDRLICGDVGFGKTEVAIRAAFKAVMNGKQAAILAPTTVLAQQHDRTFRERMADYPVRIDLLSRFRSRKEQRKTLKELKEGGVDIVIGTHRLLQPDVIFKDLGLVVVDEEQRFGVKHKERFKEKFKLIDMLTLSATPIPRTLYLALVGARDMSQIETPPVNRLPVETQIVPYDERAIRAAIQRETAREGQVFFLHNRIHSIQRARDRIRELLPDLRVEFAHGRMEEEELEEVMMRFVEGGIDVLVSTTIIESGLDIPRANTIIVDRADRFGLADLYQLRGRVGRSQAKAFALLLLPRHLMLEDGRQNKNLESKTTDSARRRVSAIRQYSQLGAGFKVAMRDLEIRGAGNVLGTEQSGHATAIGFELYCQLLKQTIARLKGEKPPPRIETRVRLDFLPVSEDHALDGVGAFIPRDYVGETRLRIWAYRRLAEAAAERELRALEGELRDRFGKLPLPVKLLFDLNKIRLTAARAGIFSVEVEENKVMLKKAGGMVLKKGRLPQLSQSKPFARIQELLGMIHEL